MDTAYGKINYNIYYLFFFFVLIFENYLTLLSVRDCIDFKELQFEVTEKLLRRLNCQFYYQHCNKKIRETKTGHEHLRQNLTKWQSIRFFKNPFFDTLRIFHCPLVSIYREIIFWPLDVTFRRFVDRRLYHNVKFFGISHVNCS